MPPAVLPAQDKASVAIAGAPHLPLLMAAGMAGCWSGLLLVWLTARNSKPAAGGGHDIGASVVNVGQRGGSRRYRREI